MNFHTDGNPKKEAPPQKKKKKKGERERTIDGHQPPHDLTWECEQWMNSTGLTSSFKLTLMVVPGTMPRSEKTQGSWRSEPAQDSTRTFLSCRYWSTLMFSSVWIISRTSFTVIPTLTSSVMRSPSCRPKISMVLAVWP